jgi:hypothetical protein
MSLIRIVYVSKYKIPPRLGFGAYIKDIKDILASAQRNNKARNVTGALLFDDAFFVQALEGEEADVKAIFAKIGADQRHYEITAIMEAAAPSRLFGNWWMAGLLKSGMTASLFELYRRDGKFDPSKLAYPPFTHTY